MIFPKALSLSIFTAFFLKRKHGFYAQPDIAMWETRGKDYLLITAASIFCQAPSSILESLETHMNGLEDAKGGKKG